MTDRSPRAHHDTASKPPRVAVIIPCFNDGALVGEALASLQEPEPLEIVIVDDASTALETRTELAALERNGIRVVRHAHNQHLAQARMTGLRVTSAPYVFPLDSDDHAVKDTLSAMADCLDADPSAAVCTGDYAEFGEHELVRAVPGELDPYRLAYANEYPVSALFRRSALVEAGGWRRDLRGYEDWDLWMALAERGARIVHLGEGRLTYRRRLHGTRMLTEVRRRHRQAYRELKRGHPKLFADIAEHRRRSPMARRRKVLYPLIYGGRKKFSFELRVKSWLDRRGVWTLRR